jgi:hypothetical protein
MSTWAILTVIGIGGLGAIATLLWFLGRNSAHDTVVELESALKQAEKKAENEKRTAEIFTIPRGDWDDVINKL